MAPEPFGFVSFDDDLEEEIDTTNFTEHILEEYHTYLDIFSKWRSQWLLKHTIWYHAIDLKLSFKTQAPRIYPLSLEKHNKLGKFVKEHLFKGAIRWLTAHSAASFFFIDKKDRKLHPVQYYCHLNKNTIRNVCPLPLIQELLDVIKGATIFLKLDMWWGYNNVHIKEGDESKAAFVTPIGLFEPIVMFFGLTNSPATF